MSQGAFSSLRPIVSSGLRDQIAAQIRNAILDGDFDPGDHLIEMNIAEQLDVSRAPVREALSSLERDGLVERFPRRGYYVVEFTLKDIEEIYSLRLLLELEALRRVVGRFVADDIAKLQQIIDDLDDAIRKEREPREVAELDLSFHEFICKSADHSRLYSVWNNMRMQTWLLIGVTSKTHYNSPGQPREFHQNILDEIRTSNLERAESLLKEHIMDAQRRALQALPDLPPSPTE